MTLKLYICEKPSQGKTVAQALGMTSRDSGGYIREGELAVAWGVGHIVEPYDFDDYDPELKRWQMAALPFVPSEWKMKVKSGFEPQVRTIQKLLKEATEVVIATDLDREGEVIGCELIEFCGYKGKVSRIQYSAMDETSLSEAFKNEKSADFTQPLYFAGLARQRADWLLGLNLTRFYTIMLREKGLEGVWSVGRVQTTVANLVVMRDREIENFISKPYYENHVTLSDGTVSFSAQWCPALNLLDDNKQLLDQGFATAAADAIKRGDATVTRVTKNTAKEAAPLPFSLSALQMLAVNRWGFSLDKTLSLVQSLYETHKVLSYPRADCGYLKEEMASEIDETLAAIIATDSSIANLVATLDRNQRTRAWDSQKVTAHHAIIPTRDTKPLSSFTEDEKKIYLVVRDHYLAQFMPSAETDKTTIELLASGHNLVAKGSIPKVLGWKSLLKDTEEKEEESTLPDVTEGQHCNIEKVETKNCKTTPPAHYTQATLLSAMCNAAKFVSDPALKKMLKESAGLGTEATRSNIFKLLFNREYMVLKGKKILSTEKGRTLVDIVSDDIKSVGVTALWEQQLDEIANRKGTLTDFMARMTETVSAVIHSDRPQIDTSKLIFVCPKCGKNLRHAIKQGKGGYNFWSCTGYPECKTTFDNKAGKPDLTGSKKPAKKTVTKKAK